MECLPPQSKHKHSVLGEKVRSGKNSSLSNKRLLLLGTPSIIYIEKTECGS